LNKDGVEYINESTASSSLSDRFGKPYGTSWRRRLKRRRFLHSKGKNVPGIELSFVLSVFYIDKEASEQDIITFTDVYRFN
jgi:hypothetical protein